MYLFTSERLGFRNWIDDDIPKMTALNADPEVMKFFPALQDTAQTKGFIERMQRQYEDKGFCYFAVELLSTKEFIGFIGLSIPRFEAEFTPCVDMGWRLDKQYWGNGYASEGAKRCIEYGFEVLELENIVAICPEINKPSEGVMKKIGMKKKFHFKHPLLLDNERLKNCLLYEITNTTASGT
jgi:RimJ/RimL family protein N-acetyltransferase